MGWSNQAAVVSGGQLQLPTLGVQQSNIPNIAAAMPGGQAVMLASGPGLAVTGHKGWAQFLLWSDTTSGSGFGITGPHAEVRIIDTNGNIVTVFAADEGGILLPSVTLPPTPPAGCYLFYNNGTLFAKGPSGTAVAIATT